MGVVFSTHGRIQTLLWYEISSQTCPDNLEVLETIIMLANSSQTRKRTCDIRFTALYTSVVHYF
jgi:hypothetical protein